MSLENRHSTKLEKTAFIKLKKKKKISSLQTLGELVFLEYEYICYIGNTHLLGCFMSIILVRKPSQLKATKPNEKIATNKIING